MRLDPIDRRILALLQRDGRATYASIGEVVGLSAPAMKRRVDRLRQAGAIRAFTVALSPEVLGWTTEAYIELFFRSKTTPKDLLTIVERYPEILAACTVTGEADAVLHVVAENVRHLERIVEMVGAEPCIVRTRSAIVLARVLARQQNLNGQAVQR